MEFATESKSLDAIPETNIVQIRICNTSLHLKDITGTLGSELLGKKIALCVTGSVSITEAPRIARLLMRHGADVIPVLTPKAAEFISPMIFEWSTGNQPVTKLTGRVEHVELVSSNRVDLILIAPCTANTLGKISSGVCDEPVSTLACTALGTGIPILIASAMHEPMHRNPIIQQAKEKLASAGIKFIEGPLIESKSKLAEPEEIVRAVISIIGAGYIHKQDLANLNFVITAGATREPIDNVRYITNASSGKMGVALAEAALSRGAKKVSLIHGPSVQIPELMKGNGRLEIKSVVTSEEMLGAVLSKLSKDKFDVLISAAAPSDYASVSPVHGKIITSEHPVLNLRLSATKKIISEVKDKFPNTFVTAFKAEYGTKDLLVRARETLKSSGCDLVVANNVERDDIGFGSDFNEVSIVTTEGEAKHLPKATKNEIANGILDLVLEKIQQKEPPATHS